MCGMSVEIFDCLKCERNIYVFKNHNTQPKYGLIVKSYLFPSTWLTKKDRMGLVVDSYYNIKLSASDPKLHSILQFFPLGCMIDNQSDMCLFRWQVSIMVVTWQMTLTGVFFILTLMSSSVT